MKYHGGRWLYLHQGVDRGLQPGFYERARSAQGEYAVESFYSENRRTQIAVSEAIRAKPHHVLSRLQKQLRLFRGLLTPKQLDLLNKLREERGLPREALRTSSELRRRGRNAAYLAKSSADLASVQASRPLKPPGRR